MGCRDFGYEGDNSQAVQMGREQALADLTKATDPELRLESYFFSFGPTGVAIVDEILSAVAAAGKRYHSTEWWDDDDHPPTPVEVIQQAADQAAARIRESVRRLR